MQDPVDRTLSAHRKHMRRASFLNCARKEAGVAWRQYAGGGCKPNFEQAVAEVLAGESPMCLFNQSVRFPSRALIREVYLMLTYTSAQLFDTVCVQQWCDARQA